MNWFVALPIVLGRPIGYPPPLGTRVLHAADHHMTLAFLGRVSEDAARAGWGLAGVDIEPREILLGDMMVLGGPGPRALVIALDLDPEMRALIAHARDAICDAAGAARDERAPLPHVTIARISAREGRAARRVALGWARSLDLARTQARIDRVALYTTAPEAGDRRYRIVESRAL